jgi:choline transport protein
MAGSDKKDNGFTDLQPVPTILSVSQRQLKRNISTLGLIGVGLEILNGWISISSTIVIGLAQGGTVTILYGFIAATVANLLIALTLAEMSSSYPSAGGQYVWSSILAPTKCRRAVSFVTGCLSISA